MKNGADKIEERMNVLTHGAGLLFGIIVLIVLVGCAIRKGDPWLLAGNLIYSLCMTFSYATSTFYHASSNMEKKASLRRFDHSAIYLHIAGTYTPFLLVTLRHMAYWGWGLLTFVWLSAALGVWLSFRKMKKKNHLKTVCYLLMGWVIVIAFKPLIDAFQQAGTMRVLYWLIAGGISYTVGCVFFSLDKYKYMHPIWHLFVLGGSICHFLSIYLLSV